MILVERRGDADDDRVHGFEAGVVGSGGKAVSLGTPNFFRGNAVDVRFATGKGVDFSLIDVEAGDGKFLLAEQQGKRQSDIAQADDANLRLALLNFVLELLGSAV